jgi:hypothetical protein
MARLLHRSREIIASEAELTRVTRIATIAPVLALTSLFLAGTARPAAADITAFLGLSPTPERHTVKGVAAGLTLVIVGFEFEYSHLGEDPTEVLPGLKTYSGNVFVQTPIDVGGMKFYATAGGGGYREYQGAREESHVGINFGGGIKVHLVGPVRLRLDYRVFRLQGEPLYPTYQRFYAGANLAF